jgi:hypothetical protein
LSTHRSVPKIFFIISFITFALVGCSSNNDGAIKAVESYIQALSDKDINQISTLSCTDWEQYALTEVDSLTAVGTKVEDLSCQQTSQEGDDTFVTCMGNLVLDYNGEAQKIDLSNRTYIARMEDGEWRMCGYK